MPPQSPLFTPDPMSVAFDEACLAAIAGEIPVGAVVVHEGIIIAQAGNRTRRDRDPSAHAEVVALRAACQALETDRLPGCDLYVTLEPCPMCAAAISFSRIRRLYYGAEDAKGGAVDNGVRLFNAATCHHAPDVYGGLRAQEAGDLLKQFFRDRRS